MGVAGARIVGVSEPDVGSVSVEGTQLVVDLPQSYSGDVSFSYTIEDASGATSTASVLVLSTNVLSPVTLIPDVEAPLDSVGAVISRTGQLFSNFLTIDLSSVQLLVLAFAPIVLGAVGVAVMRRELLLSITNVPLSETVDFSGKRTLVARHDDLVWGRTKGRRQRFGKSQVRVELETGETVWIDAELVEDTGF